ncbi:MAG: thioredoxin family protein, partial [Putridiphycobacter sp.]|nr:thioredoxin family protein [Putridiphycobacter sp.]
KGGADALVDYTKLNISRMKRLNKTFQLTSDTIALIKSIDKPITWLVISEGWCGDAAQNLPIINAIAEQNEQIDLRIVLRDENPELMQAYLTNGNMAIPKLIQIENDVVTQTWGPRPTVARKMVADYKAEHGTLTPEFKTDLQVWYNQDKGQNTVEDILDLLGLL